MTRRTIRRETSKGMVRTRRFVVVRPVAPETRERGAREPVLHGRAVTGLTIERGVAANERKPRLLMALNHVRNLP